MFSQSLWRALSKPSISELCEAKQLRRFAKKRSKTTQQGQEKFGNLTVVLETRRSWSPIHQHGTSLRGPSKGPVRRRIRTFALSCNEALGALNVKSPSKTPQDHCVDVILRATNEQTHPGQAFVDGEAIYFRRCTDALDEHEPWNINPSPGIPSSFPSKPFLAAKKTRVRPSELSVSGF